MAIEGKIKIEDKEVHDALHRLLLALPLGGDATPAFKSMGRALKTGVQLRFREEKAPDGSAWKPSKRAIAEGGKTLQLTRRLLRSITYAATYDSVEVGTNVVYAAIHQFGGSAGRGGRSKIDARPYLGLGEPDKVELLAILNDHLRRAWNSAAL